MKFRPVLAAEIAVITVLALSLLVPASAEIFPQVGQLTGLAATRPNNAAPDFTLPVVGRNGLTGKSISLFSFRGMVVLLEFMEPWDPHSNNMAPVLDALYAKYGSGNVAFISVAGPWNGATVNDVAQFIRNYGVSWIYLYDSSGSVFNLYGINSVPTYLFIDQSKGVIENRVTPATTLPGHAFILMWGESGNQEPALWHFQISFKANETAHVMLVWNLNESVLFERRASDVNVTFDVPLPRTQQVWRWDWGIENPQSTALSIRNFTIVHYPIQFQIVVSYSGEQSYGILAASLTTPVSGLTYTASITVSPVGAGANARLTVDGQAVGSGERFTWNQGSQHTLTVQKIFAADNPGTQYVFTGWSDGVADASRAITVTNNAMYTALYKIQYQLTINSDYGSATGAGWYDEGSKAYAVLDTSTTSDGLLYNWDFAGWTDDASGTNLKSNPVTMDSPKTATAEWNHDFSIAFYGIIVAVIAVATVAGIIVMKRGRGSKTLQLSPQATRLSGEQKFCRECGAKIPRDSKFCEECGRKLV